MNKISKREILIKIAKAIDKAGCNHCPCERYCHVYSDVQCIEKIVRWLELAISK